MAPQQQCVLVLVSREANRQLISQRLGDAVDVATDPDLLADPDPLDLIIVDAPAFRAHGERLAELRAAQDPTLLPVLFLSGTTATDRLPEAVWDTVDDVVSMPIGTRELDARVRSLLRQRAQSLELTRLREESERRFETLFDATPDPVAVVTPDGTLTNANRAFVETYDVDPDAIGDTNVADIKFEPARRVERLLLRVVEEPGAPEDATVQWTTPDGTNLFAELRANVVNDLDGASERIGIFRDVTARTNYEQELERQNDRLEEFAGTIAHDLRNPLNIARGHLGLARDGDETAFDHVEDAHARMGNLIEEVLSLAQQGTVVLDPEPVDLAATARSAWRHVETADATLSVAAESTVLADEGRLVSLFENLYRNAIEHGGEDVEVRVVPVDGGFAVEDDGPGFAEDTHRDLFDHGVTTNDGGTGFGLAIVEQIGDAHGWRVEAGEAAGGGARVEIRDVEVED